MTYALDANVSALAEAWGRAQGETDDRVAEAERQAAAALLAAQQAESAAQAMGADQKIQNERLDAIPPDLVTESNLLTTIEAHIDPSLLVEGTFAPTIGFATPGDSVIAHTVQTGRWQKIGGRVVFAASVTATITKGTASGRFRLMFSDIPYLPLGALGVGVLRIKPGQINMGASDIWIIPQVLSGVQAVEFGMFTRGAGTSVYVTEANVEDGAMTIALRGEFWT